MTPITRRQQLLFHAALLGALAGCLFVIARRSLGQPLPPMPAAVASSSEPEFVRAWGWYRAADASNYVLTVNDTFIYMLPAKGTNGSTMVVTNVGMESGTNTVALYASNPSGKSPTVTVRHLILKHQDTGWFIVGSSNVLGTYTRTNHPVMERDRKGPDFYFKLQTWQTNWLDERTL